MDATRRSFTIAELLETRNVAAVAKKIGLDPSTLYRARDGKLILGGDKLQLLAQLCGVDANQIELRPLGAARAS